MKKKILTIITILTLAFATAFGMTACESKDYTVEFNSGGGTAVESVKVEIGESVTLPTPTREGWEFDGWFENLDSSGSAVASPYTPTSNVTLYAKWHIIVYTVSYNSNGGSNASAQIVSYGESVTLPTPTREGYTFGGWFENLDLSGSAVASPFAPTKSVILYAAWSENNPPTPVTSYTVTFNSQGGTEFTSITVQEGVGVLLPTPTREGYTFDGWFVNEDLSGSAVASPYVPTSSITLHAKWSEVVPPTPETYTITFNSNGGTEVAEITVTEGESITLPTPTREGYTFDGWFTSEGGDTVVSSPCMPKSDITLYAKWNKIRYTVSFNSKCDPEIPAQIVPYGKSITLPTPTREGYTFGGWFSLSPGNIGISPSPFTPTKDITLYAVWNAVPPPVITYNITLKINDATSIPLSVAEGESVTLPTPTREGYTFGGWFVNEDLSGSAVTSPYVPTSSITLYAKWIENTPPAPITYTVTFNVNGGNAIQSQTVNEGRSVTLPMPTRNDHTFIGWFVNEDLSGTAVTSLYVPTSSITLHAKWIENTPPAPETYTITFNVNGGTAVDAITVNAGESVSLPTPTREGYTFGGWFESENLSGTAVTSPYSPTSSITLYAKWTAVVVPDEPITTYTITFNSNGGTAVDAITVNAGESVSLPTPTREGCTLAGWYVSLDLNSYSVASPYTPTSNIILYAKWSNNPPPTPTKYTITFNSNGGTKVPKFTVNEGESVPLPTPTREGYTFGGWFVNEDLSGSAVASPYFPTSSITLYAKWIENTPPAPETYTITFNVNGGTAVAEMTVTEGESVSLPTPTREGYTFGGWFVNEDLSGSAVTSPYIPTSSITLYAKWIENTPPAPETYTVTFNVNGGNAIQSQTVNEGESITALPTPTRNDHTFIGWFVNEDLSGTAVTSPYFPTSSITLHAAWSYDYSHLTFTLDGEGYAVAANASETETMPFDLSIPSTYNGKNVTAIADNAFAGCTAIQTATIPNTVTTIGENAFSGCNALTEVSIPQSVTNIKIGAFADCTVLERVTIVDMEAWLRIDFGNHSANPLNNGCGLYIGRVAESGIIVPESITKIKPYAFYGCTSLKAIVIANSATEIGASAFSNCSELRVFNAPQSVKSVGKDAFYNCTALARVYVSDMQAWLKTEFANLYANPLYYAGELYVEEGLVRNFVLPSEITTIKAYAFCGSTSLISIELHERATEIGENAFYDCAALSDVVIPTSITKIGVNAFYGCKALSKFNIPDFDAWLNIDFGSSAANPMYNAVTLTIGGVPVANLDIPEGKTVKPYALSSRAPFTVTLQGSVTEIGDYAFYDCRATTGITLPTSIVRVGRYAFANCDALTQIQLPNINYLGEGAFSGCESLSEFDIPDGVTEVLASTFFNCYALSSIVIPDTVVSIGERAFANCSKLSSVTFGSGLTQIGVNAFVNCTALTEIVIPKNVSFVGDGAFSGCTSVTTITLNEGLVSIGGFAFSGSSITSLVIPDSVTSLDNAAFAASHELESVVIGDGLTTIGTQAFVSCFNLTSVTFGARVEVIGARAFMLCKSLTSVVIPSTVKTIEYNAFAHCDNLTSIVIPSSVEIMGAAVFFHSYNLTDIWCEATETPSGWDERWKDSSVKGDVHFGDTWHYVDGVPTLKTAA